MTQPHDLTLDEPLPETRRLTWLPLLLLGLAWGVLVPVMTAQAVLATATFVAETATAADHVEQHRGLGLALVVSACSSRPASRWPSGAAAPAAGGSSPC